MVNENFCSDKKSGPFLDPFLVPRSAVGTYGLAFVRACVCAFVGSAEISKSVHRNFLIFGTKLGLPNATEVTFSEVPKKSRLAKNQRFGQFLKI